MFTVVVVQPVVVHAASVDPVNVFTGCVPTDTVRVSSEEFPASRLHWNEIVAVLAAPRFTERWTPLPVPGLNHRDGDGFPLAASVSILMSLPVGSVVSPISVHGPRPSRSRSRRTAGSRSRSRRSR